jgi:ankyrin repeat protein
MWASRGGHTETLALLLANKADINVATKVAIIVCSLEFFHF